MSETEISISKKPEFSCASLFFQFFFFLLSHPLYFSYFIFFSPYIFKLISFLSPLFITTFLLLSTLLSLSLHTDSKMGFLATTYQVIFDSLRPKMANESDQIPPLEELEAYKIVFETYTFETEENPYAEVPEVEVKVDYQDAVEVFPEKIKIFPENPPPQENNVKELKELKELKEICVPELKKLEEGEENDGVSSESMAIEKEIKDCRRFSDIYEEENLSSSSKSESTPWSSPNSFGRESSLGSYGSMRKEKEWRRTLACKLFEERHNSEGTEGMDSLWETYENTESKKLQKKLNGKVKKGKKIEEEDEQEEEEEDRDPQLCCLQALKFSAGKMNLGIGRPNLMKMSKAFKGFGWLSRHGTRKGLIHS